MTRMKKGLVFMCLVVLLGTFGCKREGGPEELAAVVNDEEITRAALVESLLERYGSMALSELIVEKLILQEAAAQGVRLSPEEKELAFARSVDQGGGVEAFQDFLVTSGRTQETFRTVLFTQMLLRKLVEKDLVITDEEIEEKFKQLYGERRTFQQISVRKVIPELPTGEAGEPTPEEALVPEGEQKEEPEAAPVGVEEGQDAKAEAEEILKELKRGADFTRIAVKRTEPLEARPTGGIYFEVPRGVLPPELEEVTFSLEEGEISPVLESEGGYHIIRVISITPAQEVELKDKKEELREVVKQERTELLAWELARRLQEDAKIERHFSPWPR